MIKSRRSTCLYRAVRVCTDLPTHAVIRYCCRKLFGKLHRRLPVAQNNLVDPIDTSKLIATHGFSGIIIRPAGE